MPGSKIDAFRCNKSNFFVTPEKKREIISDQEYNECAKSSVHKHIEKSPMRKVAPYNPQLSIDFEDYQNVPLFGFGYNNKANIDSKLQSLDEENWPA